MADLELDNKSGSAARQIFYGWWIVVAAFLNLFFVVGIIFYGFPVFYPSLVDSLGFTRAEVKKGADSTILTLIDDAEERLRGAIDELREVAHGIYPAVLSSGGLGAAVDALRERASIPINVTSLPDDRLPGSVESAAYFLIAEIAGPVAVHAGATKVAVDARRVGDSLVITVRADSAERADTELEGRFIDLEDRIGALGGHLHIEHDEPAQLTVRAEIPCAS